MSKKTYFELPSKGVWRSMKKVRDRELCNLKVAIGEEITLIDAPITFNLRFIPRVFTAPLQAIGVVTSIFARMTNMKIIFQVKDDEK